VKAPVRDAAVKTVRVVSSGASMVVVHPATRRAAMTRRLTATGVAGIDDLIITSLLRGCNSRYLKWLTLLIY
jgi:hypothetical protein